MNKYITLMILVVFLIFMTLLANAIDPNSATDIIGSVGTQPDGLISGIEWVFVMFGTFWKMMSFQIVGIPAFITLIVFYPITFGIAYMVIDIIRGNG